MIFLGQTVLNNNFCYDLSVDIDVNTLGFADRVIKGSNPKDDFIVFGDTDNRNGMSVFAVMDEKSENLNIVKEQSDDSLIFLQFAFYNNHGNQIQGNIPIEDGFMPVWNIYLEKSGAIQGIFILCHGDRKLSQIVPAGKYKISLQVI